jgi:hypothetical protein
VGVIYKIRVISDSNQMASIDLSPTRGESRQTKMLLRPIKASLNALGVKT